MLDPRARDVVLSMAAAVALALRVAIVVATEGTNDMSTWVTFARLLEERGPAALYLLGPAEVPEVPGFLFNHPPPTLALLWALNRLSALGVPFDVAFRLVPVLADLGTAGLVYVASEKRLLGSLLYLFSPLTILVSAFHGNTDSLLAFVTLAALVAATRGASARAGALLALATGVKLSAILVGPAVLLTCADRRRALVAAALVAAAVWLPGLALAPATFLARTVGYVPLGGAWGFAWLLAIGVDGSTPHGPVWWVVRVLRWAFMRSSRPLVVAVFALTWAAHAWRGLRGGPLAAVALVLFLAWTPGFGTQYLVWPAAVVLLLDLRWGAAFHVAAGAFLFLLYSDVSGGTWRRASFFEERPWSVATMLAGLVAWWVTFTWAAELVREALRARPQGPAAPRERENGAA